MDNTLLKAATVGCGRMGAFPSSMSDFLPSNWLPIGHLESLTCNDNLSVVGAVDSNEEVRNKVHVKYGIPTYRDLGSLLETNQVDLLTIATRTPAKLELVKAAFDKGVRLFHIEKPLCNSLDELEQFEKLLSSCTMTYGCLRRYITPFRSVEKYASDYNLGKLQVVQVCFGKSMLYWTHTHAIDYLLMQIKSPPKAVHAVFESLDVSSNGKVVNNDPVLMNATIYFEDGAIGLITAIPGNTFNHVFENGGITIKNDGNSSILTRRSGDNPYPLETEIDLTQAENGSTGNAVSLLTNSFLYGGDFKKQADTARDAAILGQRIMFAMVDSHLNGGRSTPVFGELKCRTLNGLHKGVPA